MNRACPFLLFACFAYFGFAQIAKRDAPPATEFALEFLSRQGEFPSYLHVPTPRGSLGAGGTGTASSGQQALGSVAPHFAQETLARFPDAPLSSASDLTALVESTVSNYDRRYGFVLDGTRRRVPNAAAPDIRRLIQTGSRNAVRLSQHIDYDNGSREVLWGGRGGRGHLQ